jgi:hypothetical protein
MRVLATGGPPKADHEWNGHTSWDTHAAPKKEIGPFARHLRLDKFSRVMPH